MKTYIIIKGQINGNLTILKNLPIEGATINKLPFNNYQIKYNTKKQALASLRNCLKNLKQDGAEKINDLKFIYDASACFVSNWVTI
jgi:hypothetical protein